ncbi:MAG TPA: hypothetical protein VFU12_00620 [Glycomyces sp.]|nr:hypothetical protein [Glycomyces sp.]
MTSRPDIEFTSTVKAEELRFHEAPRAEVTFGGSPGRRSAKRSRRVNLPEPVEPGVDYRDVHVEYDFAVSIDLPDEAEQR